MTRIARRFETCRETGRKALITYLTGGDPEPDATVGLMRTLADSGADIIEVGMPFSDPMADGPVIQAACERALAHGTGVRRLLDIIREFRRGDDDTPVVLMGYLNPIEQMGYDVFAREAAAAGVDGVLTVDLPPEESGDLVSALTGHDLDPIWLVAPTTRRERIRSICDVARGFVYYVSLKGVTGAATLDVADVERHVADIRAVTQLPVGVGFGIRDARTAGAVAGVADAVVVGSGIVRLIGEHVDDAQARERAVGDFVASLRAGMDGRNATTTGEA